MLQGQSYHALLHNCCQSISMIFNANIPSDFMHLGLILLKPLTLMSSTSFGEYLNAGTRCTKFGQNGRNPRLSGLGQAIRPIPHGILCSTLVIMLMGANAIQPNVVSYKMHKQITKGPSTTTRWVHLQRPDWELSLKPTWEGTYKHWLTCRCNEQLKQDRARPTDVGEAGQPPHHWRWIEVTSSHFIRRSGASMRRR